MGAIVAAIPHRRTINEAPFHPLRGFAPNFTFFLFGAANYCDTTLTGGNRDIRH